MRIDIVLPAAEAKRAETQVIPQVSFCVEPTLGIELVWIRENLRVVCNRPVNSVTLYTSKTPLDVPMVSDDRCTFGNQVVLPPDIRRCTMRES